MTRRLVLKVILILAGTLVLTPCRPPTPVAAAVEFAPGVGTGADQPVIKELVAAFNDAEAAVAGQRHRLVFAVAQSVFNQIRQHPL